MQPALSQQQSKGSVLHTYAYESYQNQVMKKWNDKNAGWVLRDRSYESLSKKKIQVP